MEIPSHFQITNLSIAGGYLSFDLGHSIMLMNLCFLYTTSYDESGVMTSKLHAKVTEYSRHEFANTFSQM